MKSATHARAGKLLKSSLFQTLFPPAVLLFLTGLIYYPSLKYPFQFDDIANIAKRFAIRFDNPFDRWFTHTRWFGDWLNRLNYQWGGFDPFWYRTFNLGIHLIAGMVVFFLTYSLCTMIAKRWQIAQHASLISFTAAGLFLLHPVQTQTVSYVIQARQEGLATMFVLMTLLAYVRTLLAKTTSQRVLCGSWFVVTAMLSRGTKELVVALPFLILLVEWFFVAQEDWGVFRKRFMIGMAVAGVFLLAVLYQHPWSFIRDAITLNATTINNRGNILTPNPYDIITPWMFFISELRVIVHYLAIFFWPFDISVEYDWKITSSFFTPQVVFPAIILAALVGFIVLNMWRRKRSFTVFGLLWFFIAIAPRSTIIPSPELACDYKTYLASYGVLLMISVWLVEGAFKLAEVCKERLDWAGRQEMQMVALSLVLCVAGYSAYERNKVWSSAIGFWQDNVAKAPLKARVHNNLGVALSESGKYAEAIPHYYRALALDAYYADPYSNLAVAYSMQDQVDKAIEALRNAIHIFPEYPEAYNNLGTLLLQKGNREEAEEALLAAVKLRPYYGKAYYNLARLYEERGNDNKAWEYLKAAVEGDLDVPEIYFRFGQMSMKIQKYDHAVRAFEWVINHGEAQDQVWFNLANSYYMQGQQDKARDIYQRLANNNPLDARYTYNLAEAHYAKKEYEMALTLFKRVTELPQPIAQSFFRVASCLEQLNRYDDAKNFLLQLQQVKATDEFKTALRSEIGRLELQQQVKQGNGTVTLTQLKGALAGNVSEAKQS